MVFEGSNDVTINVNMLSDDQWRDIKEDKDIAEYAEIYNDNSKFTFCTLL